MQEITVEELSKKLNKKDGQSPFILDVREPFEYEISNIEGTLIPLNQLKNRLGEIEEHKTAEVVVMCRSGGRSAQASRLAAAPVKRMRSLERPREKTEGQFILRGG